MEIILVKTNEVVTDDYFKKELHPNTSFPNGPVSPENLDYFEAKRVLSTAPPQGEFWQYPIRDGVERRDGEWVQKWKLGPEFSKVEDRDAYVSEKLAEQRRVVENAITKEREKKILEGATFGKVRLIGNEETIKNLDTLALAAFIRKSIGSKDVTYYRDADNVIHELSPDEMLDLWSQATSYVENLYKKSWVLKDGEEIPLDYKDEKHWS